MRIYVSREYLAGYDTGDAPPDDEDYALYSAALRLQVAAEKAIPVENISTVETWGDDLPTLDGEPLMQTAYAAFTRLAHPGTLAEVRALAGI